MKDEQGEEQSTASGRAPDTTEEDGFDPERDYDAFFEDEEEEQPRSRRGMRMVLFAVVAAMLLGNVVAFWPHVYNWDAIVFLRKSAQLMQNDQIQAYKEAIVTVSTKSGKGSGFNLLPEGLIVTNHHVVDEDERPFVEFGGGDKLAAEVIASDASRDLALLAVTSEIHADLPTLPLGVSQTLDDQAHVYVIGSPLFFTGIANEGNYAGLTRLTDWPVDAMVLQAPIYKGNSGSPVIDKQGRVVGVVFATMKLTVDGEREKVGLAVPVEAVKELAQQYGWVPE